MVTSDGSRSWVRRSRPRWSTCSPRSGNWVPRTANDAASRSTTIRPSSATRSSPVPCIRTSARPTSGGRPNPARRGRLPMPESVHVLGISAFYHDSAAALVRDGEIVAAAQEERFTRKKHDSRFPTNAIHYCLEAAQLDPRDLDAVAFYDSPVLSLDRIMRTLIVAGRDGRPAWLRSAPSWLSGNLAVERLVREALKADIPVLFSEHHFS